MQPDTAQPNPPSAAQTGAAPLKTITLILPGGAELQITGTMLVPRGTKITSEAPADAVDAIHQSTRHDTPREVAIAVAAHEAHRAYSRTLGDSSHSPWHDTPGDVQASAIEGVRNIQSGEVTSPEQSHTRWMAGKLDAGWTYGPEKSHTRKTHPNLRPYAELPEQERVKDKLFFAVATALLGK